MGSCAYVKCCRHHQAKQHDHRHNCRQDFGLNRFFCHSWSPFNIYFLTHPCGELLFFHLSLPLRISIATDNIRIRRVHDGIRSYFCNIVSDNLKRHPNSPRITQESGKLRVHPIFPAPYLQTHLESFLHDPLMQELPNNP